MPYSKNEYSSSDINEYNFIHENTKFTIITDDALEYCSEITHKPEAELRVNMHFHMYYELFYIYDGELEMHFQSGVKKLSSGDLLVVSPKCNHKIISNSCRRFTLNFNISKIKEVSDFDTYSLIKQMLRGDYLYLENVSTLYIPLREITKSIELNNKISIGLGFHELITQLIRLGNLYFRNSDGKGSSGSFNTENLRYYKLQALLNANYNTDISIEDVALELNLSVRQTNRTVLKVYGCGFREIIRMLRMNQAGLLLLYSDMNISEIAQNVGYSSICGFYSAFFRHFNAKPLEYRKRYGSVDKKAKKTRADG